MESGTQLLSVTHISHNGRVMLKVLLNKIVMLYQGLDHLSASIFAEASISQLQDPSNSHSINTGHVTYCVHAAAAWLTNEGEAVFGDVCRRERLLPCEFG